MNPESIKTLLEKYFDGETSIAEERELKRYFSQQKVDAELAKYRPLFLFLKEEKEAEMPQQQAVKLRPLPRPKLVGWRRFRSMAAAAATVAAFAVGGYLYQQNMTVEKGNPLFVDTYDDPEKAKAEIQKALALVSRKMNKGKKEAAKGLVKVDKIQIFKNR